MRGTRTVLASGVIALIVIFGSSAHTVADECLAKPGGPAPKGQHWYYRIDHANNGRQCWYSRAEIVRVQKNQQQAETDPSEVVAQTIQTPLPRAAATALAAEIPPEKTEPVTAPIPWLNVQKLPAPTYFVQQSKQTTQSMPTQLPDATAIAPSNNTAADRTADPPIAVPNRPAMNEASALRARELPRHQQPQTRPEPPAPAISRVDHTFALLMTLFAALAIAGPALHIVERRRRREALNFRPPPWARVIALNAPKPRIRVMMRPQRASQPAPVLPRPPDQTERLAHALQQLVDRLQTTEPPEPRTIRVRPRGHASM
jgi:hypothetical protein